MRSPAAAPRMPASPSPRSRICCPSRMPAGTVTFTCWRSGRVRNPGTPRRGARPSCPRATAVARNRRLHRAEERAARRDLLAAAIAVAARHDPGACRRARAAAHLARRKAVEHDLLLDAARGLLERDRERHRHVATLETHAAPRRAGDTAEERAEQVAHVEPAAAPAEQVVQIDVLVSAAWAARAAGTSVGAPDRSEAVVLSRAWPGRRARRRRR